eukprot:scaffold23793_cov25-Tisochrysis_lutea.AAC.1
MASRSLSTAENHSPAMLHTKFQTPLLTSLAMSMNASTPVANHMKRSPTSESLKVAVRHSLQLARRRVGRDEIGLRAVHRGDLGGLELVDGVERAVSCHGLSHGVHIDAGGGADPRRRERSRRGHRRLEARSYQRARDLDDGDGALLVGLHADRLRPDKVVQVVDRDGCDARGRDLHDHAGRRLACLRVDDRKPRGEALHLTVGRVGEERVGDKLAVEIGRDGVDAFEDRVRHAPCCRVGHLGHVALQVEDLIASVETP